jgi:thymidylate synthase (FAD)
MHPGYTRCPVATTDRVIAEDAIRVLDHGFVRLDGSMATDLSVVNAARVSASLAQGPTWTSADEGLIRFLMRDRHGTPFEHNSFRFHIRCPIFVAREWFRHRSGPSTSSRCATRRRPTTSTSRSRRTSARQVGKPGAYSFEPVDEELAERTREELRESTTHAYETYTRLVEAGVARELARSVMPVGAYTEFFWTVNAAR